MVENLEQLVNTSVSIKDNEAKKKSPSVVVKDVEKKEVKEAKEVKQTNKKINVRLMPFGDWFDLQKFVNAHRVTLKIKGIDEKRYVLISYKNDISDDPARLLFNYENSVYVPALPSKSLRIFSNDSFCIRHTIDEKHSLVTFGGKGKKLLVFPCVRKKEFDIAYQKSIRITDDFEFKCISNEMYNMLDKPISNFAKENFNIKYPQGSKFDAKTIIELVEKYLWPRFKRVRDPNHLKLILASMSELFTTE